MESEIGAATSAFSTLISILNEIMKHDDSSPQDLKVIIQHGWNALEQVTKLELQGFDTTEISEVVKFLNEWCYEAEDLLDKQQLTRGSSNHCKKICNKLSKLIKSDEIKQVCEKAKNSVSVIQKTNAPSCTESDELVAEKCEGLPLVAEWLGTAIEQKSIVGYINNESLSQDNDFKKQVFPRLMSSYEQRRCFGYLSLFPVSHCFTIDFLVHLWMGEGFIQPPEETQSLKQVEEKFDRDIQERLILQPSTQLNSFGQDFARLAALGACVLLDQDVSNKKVRHLSFLCKDFNITWHEVFDNKRLRTFLSLRIGNEDGDSLKVPPNFCKKLSLLRVLSFEGLNIEKIPDCIHHLIHLRYFDISFTPVKILTKEFHQLKALMFLKLKGTKIFKWLDDFHKLTDLIYVDWEDSTIREVGTPYRIGRLSKLESLPLFKVGNKEGYLISELKEMNKLQGILKIMDLQRVDSYEEATKAMLKDKRDLTTIILEWNSNSNSNGSAENVLSGLELHENVKELKLIKYGGENIPDWIKDSCLEKIHLEECRSLAFFRELGKLKYLKTLVLQDMESITVLSCRSSDDTQTVDMLFPALETLKMVNMTQLRKMMLQANDMPCLCEFEAAGCNTIASLFSSTHGDYSKLLKSIFENKLWGHTLKIKIDDLKLPHDELEASAGSGYLRPTQKRIQWKVDGDDEHERLPIDLKRPNSINNEAWLELLRESQVQKAKSSRAQSSSIMPLTWMTFKAATSSEGISNDEVHKVKLYFGLFTSDYEFEKDTIVQLWMATGLFHELSEQVGYLCFDRLLKEEFIIKSRTDILRGIDKYKVNDVNKVTTFADWDESKRLYAMIDDNNGLSAVDMFTCWHVSVMTKSIDPEIFKDNQQGKESELRSFLLICDYGSTLKHIPYSFFKVHPWMQALDLSGSHISELPSSLGNMKQLRFLGLSFTLIQSIPESIAHLQELQTLKLEGCKYLHMLPDGMKQLTNLQYLDFDVLGQLNFMPQGMGSLTKLRTLSAFIVGGEGCSLRELKNLNNICGSFCISGLEYASIEDAKEAAMPEKKCLTGLHLKWNGSISYDKSSQDEASSILKNLEPTIIESLEELQISYYPSDKFPEWIQSSKGFERVVKVTLLRCENKEFIDLNNLSSLKHLHITDMDEVATIDHEVANIDHEVPKFPNLETLVIDGMYKLEGWTGIKLNDCQRLKKLRVRHCPKLTKLDFLPFLGSLKYLEISHCESFESLPNDHPLPASLETLIIDNCPLLKERCSKGGNDWEKIKHLPYISVDTEDIGSANKGATQILPRHKLYCSLFPNDFEFERDTLVQLWMAIGLYHVPLEDFGYSCFDRLVEEGFIIKSGTDILTGIEKYKIDVEQATTLLNQDDSKGRYALSDDNELTGVDKSKCRHLSIVSKSISPRTFETLEGISELRTVLLIRDYGDSLKKIPSSFFDALTCMRALDLSGSHISALPSSIENMSQLHFLDLSFTPIDTIPESIAGLGELQTLKLKGCKHLHTLPKGMKQLRSLRHLDFDILGQLTSMPEGMGQLTELRTLPAFIVSEEEDDHSSIRELENLNELRGSFCISGLECVSIDDAIGANMAYKQLTELHFKWNDSVSYDDDARINAHRVLTCLCPAYESLEEFKISSYPSPILTWWVKDKHFINLARLELISCKVEMFEAPDTLPNLKYLNITDMNGVKIIQGLHQGQRSDQKISFPMLETLIIDGMLNLESWTNIEEGDSPHLTKLSLMYCPKLTQLDDLLSILHSLTYLEISHCELFASLSSKPLPSLETLIINKCPALKQNYAPGKDGWKNIEHVPNIWIDMKGLGEKNQDTDSDDSDSSDEEIDHSSDSDKETGTSKDVSDDVTMM